MAEVRTCRSPCRNLLPSREDELVGGPLGAPTNDNNTLTLSPPISWAQTPAQSPAPVPSSTKFLCQQLLKSYAATVKLLK